MVRRRPEKRRDEANADARDSSKRVDTYRAKHDKLCQRDFIGTSDTSAGR